MTDPRIEAAARAYYWSLTEAVTGETPTERQWKIVRETALRAMAAALAAADRAAWRPIEEAPKDGTPVMAWVNIIERGELAARVLYPKVRLKDGVWQYRHENGWARLTLSRLSKRIPTHFQPLPAPPTEEIE